MRSATSVGANINEAIYGNSKADFISKLHISLKETGESIYWLTLLKRTTLIVYDVGLILILGYALIIPNSYTFSSDGITVRYCFGLKTFLCWKDIQHIDDCYSGGKCFPWCRSYEIAYFKTKIPFHEMARIPKNKKSKAQILKYYHKTIEKYG